MVAPTTRRPAAIPPVSAAACGDPAEPAGLVGFHRSEAGCSSHASKNMSAQIDARKTTVKTMAAERSLSNIRLDSYPGHRGLNPERHAHRPQIFTLASDVLPCTRDNARRDVGSRRALGRV